MAITLPILLLALILTFWILFGGRGNHGGTSQASSESTGVSDEWLVPSREEESRGSQTSPESSRQEESSEPEESSAEPLLMENFVGQKYADVVASAANKAIYIFDEPEYVYTDEYPEGIVADQDVTPDIEITEGTRVKLKVSQGSQYVELPSYDKMMEQDYLSELARLGITNVMVRYRKDALFKQAGYVVGTSMDAEGKYDITKAPLLEVYVSEENDDS